MDDTSYMWRTLIGPASAIVTWVIGKDDPLGFPRMVALMKNGALNPLSLEAILDENLGGTFNGMRVMSRGLICTTITR